MTDLLSILPLATVMVAGPQIISAFFLATGEAGRRNSLAFLGGVAIATTVGVTIAFLIGIAVADNTGGGREGRDVLTYLIIALLVFLMVRIYLRRKESKPPKWMGTLTTATTALSFRLGVMLFLLMPTNVVTMLTVGAFLAREDASLWHAVPFILLTLLLASLPLLMLIVLGRRAETVLPKVREWLMSHSWLVNELVVLFFLVLQISSL